MKKRRYQPKEEVELEPESVITRDGASAEKIRGGRNHGNVHVVGLPAGEIPGRVGTLGIVAGTYWIQNINKK